MFGTQIDLRELSDFDTSIPTGVNHTIKGQPNVIPQSGMGMFDTEHHQHHEQHPDRHHEQTPFRPIQLPVSNESECVKVARHHETCPICSKLYNDTTIYHNYVILFLLVVCIFLIKNLYSYHDRE